ncbi:MAG: hypothetical protein HZB29_02505 [Nitrospinae bacterium]|nr:hypothetical protein [Nitrospinota bacterium]
MNLENCDIQVRRERLGQTGKLIHDAVLILQDGLRDDTDPYSEEYLFAVGGARHALFNALGHVNEIGDYVPGRNKFEELIRPLLVEETPPIWIMNEMLEALEKVRVVLP